MVAARRRDVRGRAAAYRDRQAAEDQAARAVPASHAAGVIRRIEEDMTPQVLFDDPDGTLALLRDSVAAFAARNSGTKALRERRDRGGAFDGTLWHAMADAGWIGLSLPDQIGGAGLGRREQATLSEAMGRALVAEPIVMASALSSVLLADAPDSKERTRWRPACRPRASSRFRHGKIPRSRAAPSRSRRAPRPRASCSRARSILSRPRVRRLTFW
jgi:hypothetical protein